MLRVKENDGTIGGVGRGCQRSLGGKKGLPTMPLFVLREGSGKRLFENIFFDIEFCNAAGEIVISLPFCLLTNNAENT